MERVCFGGVGVWVMHGEGEHVDVVHDFGVKLATCKSEEDDKAAEQQQQ